MKMLFFVTHPLFVLVMPYTLVYYPLYPGEGWYILSV